MSNITMYDRQKDSEGNNIDHRVRLFIKQSDFDDDGNIKTFKAGVAGEINETGKVYIVDQYVIDQIEKNKGG